jgi:hypothetical protein
MPEFVGSRGLREGEAGGRLRIGAQIDLSLDLKSPKTAAISGGCDYRVAEGYGANLNPVEDIR